MEKMAGLKFMKAPHTKKTKIVDNMQGILVADPYRWLENGDNAEVLKWIDKQNEYTDSLLRNANQKKFLKELAKNFKVVNFSNPQVVNDRYFYTEKQPNEDQFVLYFKKGLNGKAIKLVDPNGKKKGSTTTIDYWEPGMTGKYVAYGLSNNGDEMATIYLLDVDKNKPLQEKITNCRHSSIRWLPDDSGFFYTKNPRPGTVPKNEEHLHVKVYLHKLGNNPDNDELVFGKNRPKDDMINLSLSLDGKLLAVHVSKNWTENEIYIYDTNKKETYPLVIKKQAKFYLQFLKDKVLIRTNYKANNYKLLHTSLDSLNKSIDDWKEFIPESEYVLESALATEDQVLLKYLVNACSKIITTDHSGGKTGEIPIPKHSTVTGISVQIKEKEFFYSLESFTFPKIIYRFDPEKKEYGKYKETDNPIDPENYLIKQEWCLSKDGTKIPIFIFHKKEISLSGTNPTILYGYGGFASNETPSFMKNWIPWLERGGIFAIANIRGGGEFGEKWHKEGIKENKQNTFDDFISSAEFLVSQKYTKPSKLGILGGSNGGLLVLVVANQRPDLFKAVCSKVPLTDMARFPKFGIATRWTHEYGNPEIKNELESILKWSPYHNTKNNVDYPSVFLTTANKDTRVDPMHARKMSAILQSSRKKNKTLIFTEMNAGHGAGKPVSKMVELQSLIATFFFQELFI